MIVRHVAGFPLIVALGLALRLASQEPAPAHDARAYIPLTPGTTWVYAVEHPAAPAETKIQKLLTRVLQFQGEPVIELRVRCSDPAFPIVPFEYYIVSTDGLESLPLMSGTVGQWVDWHAPATLLLPCPLRAGREWDTQITMNAIDPRSEPVRGVLVEERRLVQVPATATECAYVRFERPGAKRFRHRHLELAPGIGVLRDVFEVEGQPPLRISLERFRPARPSPQVAAELLVREHAGAWTVHWLRHPYLGQLFESRFARLEQRAGSSLVRVWRGQVTPFAPGELTSVHALLRDEGIAMQHMPGQFRSPIPPLLGALALLDVAATEQVPPVTVPLIEKTAVTSGGDTQMRASILIGDGARRQVTLRMEPGALTQLAVER